MASLSHSVFASIGNPITAAMLRDMKKGSPLVTETNTSIFPVRKVKHLEVGYRNDVKTFVD
jgi:hypothetical protein